MVQCCRVESLSTSFGYYWYASSRSVPRAHENPPFEAGCRQTAYPPPLPAMPAVKHDSRIVPRAATLRVAFVGADRRVDSITATLHRLEGRNVTGLRLSRSYDLQATWICRPARLVNPPANRRSRIYSPEPTGFSGKDRGGRQPSYTGGRLLKSIIYAAVCRGPAASPYGGADVRSLHRLELGCRTSAHSDREEIARSTKICVNSII